MQGTQRLLVALHAQVAYGCTVYVYDSRANWFVRRTQRPECKLLHVCALHEG